MNWLDWLIIAILALFTLQGLRYGLVASVAKLAGALVGIVVAYSYYHTLAEYMSSQWKLEEKLLPLAKSLLKFWSPSGNIPPTTLTYGNKPSAEILAASQLEPLGDYLVRMFAFGILEAVSFLILLLLTSWAVKLVGQIFTKIADFSFLGPVNHIGGLLFGLAEGLIIVMVILTLMSPFQKPEFQSGRPSVPGTTAPLATTFQGSKLLPYFEPLFNAINRPLQVYTLKDFEGAGSVKSI